MDQTSKEKILTQLARTRGEVADKALEKQAGEIATKLEEETRFDLLQEQLKFLDAIGFRLAEKTVQIIQRFLERLDVMELSFDNELGLSPDRIAAYQNKDRLIIEAFNLLDRIRYHRVSEILEVFVRYVDSSDSDVSRKASDGLEHLAEFNIDIFYRGE